jgi:hypothetical protein
VGGDDFPIIVSVFIFSNSPAWSFRLFLLNVKTVVSWCGFELAWRGVSCRVVSWRGVVSFHVSTYNNKVSISHHEKDLHIYSKVPATYLH